MSEQLALGAKTIIWDLDGTLINSFAVFGEVLADVLPTHDLHVPPQEILNRNFHGTLADSINGALGGIPEAKLEVVVQDFLRAQDTHYEAIDHHIFPDSLALAQRAHEAGLWQIIVTNRDHLGRLNASPKNIVTNSHLNGLIDTIVCGDDSEHRKPSPEVVRPLLESGRLVVEDLVVIGDQFVDAELAYNLGARAILVSRSDEPIAHLDRLGKDWKDHVSIVSSLDLVKV